MPSQPANLEAAGAPDWVKRGSGIFEDKVWGVGMVSGLRNQALARATALNRARADVAKVLRSMLGSKFRRDDLGDEVEERFRDLVQPQDYWRHPDGTLYSLVAIDKAQAENLLADIAGQAGSSQVALTPAVETSSAEMTPQDKKALLMQAKRERVQQVRQERAQEIAAAQTRSAPEARVQEPDPKPSEPPVAETTPASRPIVAVFDVDAKLLKTSDKFLDGLTDYLSMRLAEASRFQIIPRSDLKQRMRTSKMDTYKECYDQACQIELGRELAAEKTLATQIVKLGTNCKVSAALYDLRRATTEKAATASGKCSEDELVSSLDQVIEKLLAK